MADDLKIRASLGDDLAELDALFARSYPRLLRPDYPPSVLVTVLPLISRAQPDLLRSGTYFVAELGGALVGAGGWTPHSGGCVGEVRHLITDAERQRQGIARALMQRVFESGAEADVTALSCRSTRTAVPFYQAMGFVAQGPIEVPMAPGIGFPAIQMWREM